MVLRFGKILAKRDIGVIRREVWMCFYMSRFIQAKRGEEGTVLDGEGLAWMSWTGLNRRESSFARMHNVDAMYKELLSLLVDYWIVVVDIEQRKPEKSGTWCWTTITAERCHLDETYEIFISTSILRSLTSHRSPLRMSIALLSRSLLKENHMDHFPLQDLQHIQRMWHALKIS